MVKRLACLATAASFGVSGCGRPLATLDPKLTPDQRVAKYEAMKAVLERDVQVWHGTVNSYQQRSVYLADGTKIEDPIDLLPVLPRWSKATRHIEAVTAHRRKMGLWFSGGGVGLVLGIVLGLNMVDRNSDGSQDWSKAKFPLIGGLISLTVGTAVAFHYRGLSFVETSAAYETYNEGLADSLDVCVDHLVVVPCELLPDDAGSGPGSGGLRRESKETYYPR